MDEEQFREAAASSVDEIIRYNETITDRRVISAVEPGYLAKLLPTQAPEQGEAWSAIQADIESKIQPGLTHWQHPRYMAWFPAPVTYPSMLGELYSAAFSSANFNWICSPAVTELETVMMDWVCRLLQLPDCFLSHGEGGGSIQGTASDAMLTCIVAARERYLRNVTAELAKETNMTELEREDELARIRSRLLVLSSEQAHSCTEKGARIAGVRYRSIKAHFADDLSMTAASVESALKQATRDGLIPFYLTLGYGTTGSCAVDHLSAIADVIRTSHPHVWTHVDAAYAGTALCLPEHAQDAALMSRFDSFETNLHKWGLVNLDAACLFVRQRRALTDAFTLTPSYLRSDVADRGLVTDYRDWGVPLGRRFRALKIWFVLRTYGAEGFREMIKRHVQMGERFAELVRGRADLFEVVTKPAFALTVLRCVPPKESSVAASADAPASTNGHPPSTIDPSAEGETDKSALEGLNEGTPSEKPIKAPAEAPTTTSTSAPDADAHLARANSLTRAVYERITAAGHFFLTSSVVNGAYVIRVVSANPRAEWRYLEEVFGVLVRTTEEVLREGG